MISWTNNISTIEKQIKKLEAAKAEPLAIQTYLASAYFALAHQLRDERDQYNRAYLDTNKAYAAANKQYIELEASLEPLKRERDELLADVRSQGILTAIEK